MSRDQILVVRLLLEIAKKAALKRGMKMDLGFFYADEMSSEDRGGGGEDHDLVQPGAVVFQREQSPVVVNEDCVALPRNLDLSGRVLEEGLNETGDALETPTIVALTHRRVLEASKAFDQACSAMLPISLSAAGGDLAKGVHQDDRRETVTHVERRDGTVQNAPLVLADWSPARAGEPR